MKLYVYDHCPYCVKARMIFGLTSTPVDVVYLPNDDEETPIRMIGKKMLPILEKNDGTFLPESLDILAYVDAMKNGAHQPPTKRVLAVGFVRWVVFFFFPVLHKSAFVRSALQEPKHSALEKGGCPRLAALLEKLDVFFYPLAMPRWVKAPLEEFNSESARRYFINKKTTYIGDFDENLRRSPDYIDQANGWLRELDAYLAEKKDTETSLSYDDVHLFAALRSLSIVKGLRYLPHVEEYRQRLARASNVPLHDSIAL
ncbi:MAG: glutaredoxin 2 [Rickettsiales bacterium]